jgi:hypothetical protein
MKEISNSIHILISYLLSLRLPFYNIVDNFLKVQVNQLISFPMNSSNKAKNLYAKFFLYIFGNDMSIE